jgi:hypothetical protein
VIEPTDEMITAFQIAEDAPGVLCGDTRAGLAAVLAIIARDYRLVEMCREELAPGLRCHSAQHLGGEHEARTETGNTVRWS